MAKKCPKCQSDNPDSATFCADCGTQLPSLEDIEVTETMETPKEEITTGSTFAGRYQIIEELGKGGMGRVYRALDKELNEEVAIKLIKPEIAKDKKTIERFKNELKFARKISHRNVGRMYELMEDKGSHFITMEYVPGQDLRGLIRQTGQLTTGKAIAIAKEICDGLGEAHHHGVIHRDLKPSNIIIDKNGNARILDFGIARSIEGRAITGAGVMIGTPEYMSPEQVEGKEADQRSDIYSLGIILYEMVTGKVPFEGDTPFSVGVKQKIEAPQNPKEINSQIPDSLNRVILRCLEKDKKYRYQSPEEVRSELSQIEKGIPTIAKIVSERKPLTSREITVKITPRKLLFPALLIVAAIVLVAALFFFLPQRESVRHSVAVISFENQTGSEAFDYLRTAIPNLLITGLEQSKELHVISWEKMHDLLLAMGETDTQIIDKNLGFRLCQNEGIEAIVTGSFIKTGDLFTTDVKVLDVGSKDLLKSASAKGTGIQSIMASQIDELARDISRGLGLSERKAVSNRVKIAEVTTSSMEAYGYYIKGKEAATKNYWDDAREYMERAVLLDPEFAMAHYYLARAYGVLGNTKASRETWEKALRYSKRVPFRERLEIERLYAFNIDGDNDKNIQILQQILEEFPEDTQVHYSLGYAYIYNGMEEEGIREYETYIRVHTNPTPWVYNNLGFIYARRKEMDKSLECIQKFVDLSPDDANAIDSLADIYFKKGDLDESIAQFEKALQINPDFYNAYFRIAYVYALRENYEKACDYLEKYSLVAPSPATKADSLGWRSFFHYWLGQMEDSLALSQKIPGMVEEVENKWIEVYAYFFKGLISMSRGESEQSRKIMRESMEHMAKFFPNRREMDSAQNEFLQGILDIRDGKIDNANSRLIKIKAFLEEDLPDWVEYLYWILSAHVALAEGRYEEALSYADHGLSMRWPFYNMATNWLLFLNMNSAKDLPALIYMAMGNMDKAITAYEEITEFNPNSEDRCMIHPTWHYELAKLYERNGEKDKAITRYQKFLSLWKDADPDIAEVEDARKRLTGLRGK